MTKEQYQKLKEEIALKNKVSVDDVSVFIDENGDYYDWTYSPSYLKNISTSPVTSTITNIKKIELN